MRTGTRLFVLTISQIVLWLGIPGRSGADIKDLDGDYPYTIGVGGAWVTNGNPLDQGDTIYSVIASHRFFRGDLGLEASIGYAKTKVGDSDPLLVNNPRLINEDNAELLLLDLDLVWYANYANQQAIWDKHWPVKPEFIVFGGPGYASLRITDAIPQSRFGDAADDFFTLNAGAGVNLHWFRGEHDTTSRGFVRFEARARWFGGQENSIDVSLGASLNYSFGDRPSCRALALRVEAVGKIDAGLPVRGNTYEMTEQLREEVQDLKVEVMADGSRCEYLRQHLDDYIEVLNKALDDQRNAGPSGD